MKLQRAEGVTYPVPPGTPLSPVPTLAPEIYVPDGSVILKSTSATVIDPGYPKRDIGSGGALLKDLVPGEWKLYDRIAFENQHEFLLVHADLAKAPLSDLQSLTWEVDPKNGGGDSGLICFCDVNAFEDDSLVPADFKSRYTNTVPGTSRWSLYICEAKHPAGAGALEHFPHGMVFQWDCGALSLLGRDREGKARAVLIRMH